MHLLISQRKEDGNYWGCLHIFITLKLIKIKRRLRNPSASVSGDGSSRSACVFHGGRAALLTEV